MKNSSFRAQNANRTTCVDHIVSFSLHDGHHHSSVVLSYPVGIIKMQNVTAITIHLLMTLAAPGHRQRRVHVDIMACQV